MHEGILINNLYCLKANQDLHDFNVLTDKLVILTRDQTEVEGLRG